MSFRERDDKAMKPYAVVHSINNIITSRMGKKVLSNRPCSALRFLDFASTRRRQERSTADAETDLERVLGIVLES